MSELTQVIERLSVVEDTQRIGLQRLSAVETKTENVHHEIFGDGQPGINQRLASLQTAIEGYKNLVVGAIGAIGLALTIIELGHYLRFIP